MNKPFIKLILLGIILLSSCTKEPERIVVDMGDYHKSEPVISTFFQPDSTFAVLISSTIAAYSETNINPFTVDYAYITDLKTNTNYLLHKISSSDFWTNLELAPQIENQYKINISMNQQSIKIEAIDSVPKQKEVSGFEVTNIVNESKNKVKFQINTNNLIYEYCYFEIIFSSRYPTVGTDTNFSQQNIHSSNPIITSEEYYPSLLLFGASTPQSLLFKLKSGSGLVDLDFFYYISGESGYYGTLYYAHNIHVEIRFVSYDYYRYKTTLYKQQYATSGDILYGLAAPVDLHSNLIGGRGIFAGYSKISFQQEVVERYIYY